MAKIYKSPLDLYDDINSPFDTTKIARGDYLPTPGERFEKSRLIHLTADDYYKLVANELNVKWQELKEQRRRVPNEMSVDDMKKLMEQGQKFPTPWLHLHDKLGNIPHFQEGLHRMLAASDLYGEKAKFPVYLGWDEDSLEDFSGIETDNIDDYIQAMNEKRRQHQIDYDNAQYDKEQELEQWYKQQASEHFNLPIDQITSDHVKQYKDYEDDMFKEEKDWNY